MKFKFRGKRIDNGEWVFGVPYFIKSEKVAFIINNCQTLNFSNNDSSFDGLRVIPKTIVEYTGLKDLTGKEIYEGDIVRILYTDWPSQSNFSISLEEYKKSISSIGYVVFDKTCWAIAFYSKKYDEMTTSSICHGNHGEIEIIGNIFENPELLKTLR